MIRTPVRSIAITLVAVLPATGFAQAEAEEEIAEITVEASRVANDKPAGTYAAPATALRFDPLTELQSRGIAEGQSDVTVRGGLFENTGFRLGSVTVFDPQTGHYVAELPVDPAWMSNPAVVHGIDNAVTGFNSNIATVNYSLLPRSSGGDVLAGFGSDGLDYQSIRLGGQIAEGASQTTNAAFSYARSAGDGTVPNGDHRFSRVNLGLQRVTNDAQSDLVIAYQDKFFGWPGAYTGFANLAETDETQTSLVYLNHRKTTGSGWWNVSAYYRGLEDDYDFDRTTEESGVPGSFEHETRVFAAAVDGLIRSGRVSWSYAAQATADELVRSTDLTEGLFNSRSYLSVSLVPEIELSGASDRSLTLRVGATADVSNRDSNALLPQLGLRFSRVSAGAENAIDFQYTATSQVPGYTVLNSRPAGLFGGNPLLGRERADQLTLSWSRETGDSRVAAAAFYREDKDLVDWTFAQGAPFARQANAVDLDVTGFELLGSLDRGAFRIAGGYTWLDKDSDYGDATVDASFYALNFAKHRVTLSLVYTLAAAFDIRLDNEYRVQNDNPLRIGSSETYLGSLSLRWTPPALEGFLAQVTVDNLSDSDYQPFPGTPGAGRQITVSAGYSW